jgi:hypothetical protein
MTPRMWPPLVGRNIPSWIRWRDYALTFAAWMLLAWWMRGAFLLLYDWLSKPIFALTSQPVPDWAGMWHVLAPFLAVSALLAGWLLYWSRRRRAILMQQRADGSNPPGLELAVHAGQLGISLRLAEAVQAAKVQTIPFDAAGAIAGPLYVTAQKGPPVTRIQ